MGRTAIISSLLLKFGLHEFFTASRIQDRTAPAEDIGNRAQVHLFDVLIQKSVITLINTIHLEAVINTGSYDSSDRRVHTGGVAARSKDAYPVESAHALYAPFGITYLYDDYIT